MFWLIMFTPQVDDERPVLGSPIDAALFSVMPSSSE
jgi:hypothetical protein